MADYDFRSLSSMDFEQLTRDLLNRKFRDEGVAYRTFGPGPDGGIDIRSDAGRLLVGQCKLRPDLSRGQMLRLAEAERARWADEAVDGYTLVVSAEPSPSVQAEAMRVLGLLPAGPGGQLLTRSELNSLLVELPEVERRWFKLWLTSTAAIERVTEAADWQRSEALQVQLLDRARLFVVTPALQEALDVLDEYGVVVLTGPPGAGKSTLAELLTVQFWRDGWRVVTVSGSLDSAWRVLRESEQRTVILFDDFLGQADLSEQSGSSAADLQSLVQAVERRTDRTRLVMTSRRQLLSEAAGSGEDRLRRVAEWAEDRRVEVGAMDRAVKGRLLYNHLHFAAAEGAPWVFRPDDLRLLRLVDHPNFNPRVVESVVLRQQLPDLDGLLAALRQALDDPQQVWGGSFRQLSDLAVRMLLQLVLLPADGIPLLNLYEAVTPGAVHDWAAALGVLRGTWVRELQDRDGVLRLQLYDGSRRDFLLPSLTDPSLVDAAIDEAFSMLQVLTLWRLGSDGPRAPRFPAAGTVRPLLVRRRPRIAARLTAVGNRGWAAAVEDARAWQRFNATLSGRRRYLVHREVHGRMLQELTAAAELALEAEVEPALLVEALLPRVRQLLSEMAADEVSWSPGAMLDLAVVLSQIPSAESVAGEVVAAAVADAEGLEDVAALAGLSDAARRALLTSSVRERLDEVLQDELGRLDEYLEPEGQQGALEEVESFAIRMRIDLDTEYAREQVQEYAERFQRSPRSRTFPGMASEVAGGSNRELLRMFNLLVAAGDGAESE